METRNHHYGNSSKAVVVKDTIKMVYDDLWRPILDAIGELEIDSTTTVVLDKGFWVGYYNNIEIVRDKSRAKVVQAEIKWCEKHLIK
jgi:hypothetical protein